MPSKKEDSKESNKRLKTDPSTPCLKSEITKLRSQNGLTLYYGLADYVAACKSGKEETFRLFNSTYFADIENLGHFVTPSHLRRFTTVRDDRSSKIIRIHDSLSQIEGSKLRRTMAINALSNKGFDVIIFNPADANSNEALALASLWEIEEDTVSKRRDHVKKIFKLYHDKGFTRVFCSRNQVCDVLGLEYISLRYAKSVSSKLNSLVEKQEFDLTLSEVETMKKILDGVNQEVKPLKEAFMSELLVCAVASANLRTKVAAFKKFPNARVARLLGLCKPQQGVLYSQSTGRKAEMTTLSELDQSDKVLMSTVSIDTKFFNTVSGDLSEWKVYKSSSDLGIIKDKKGWTPLKEPSEMPAKLFVKFMKSIAESNTLNNPPPQGAVTVVETTSKLADDIDI